MGDNNRLKLSWINKYIAAVICLMPILDPYIFLDIGGQEVHVVDVLCLVAAVAVIAGTRKIEINKDLFYLLIALLFISVLSFTFTDVNNRSFALANRVWMIWVLYSGLYGVAIRHVNREYTEDLLLKFGWVVSIFLLIQIVCLTVRMPIWDGQLPLLSLGEDDSWHPFYETTGVIRAHSVFQEPSYYAIYMLPVISVALKKERLWHALFFSGTVVLTTSSIGLFGVSIIGSMYILSNLNTKIKKKFIKRLFAIVILATIVIVVGYSVSPQIREIVGFMFDKIGKIGFDLQDDRMGSTRLRLIGNATIFSYFSFSNKLLGLGIHQYMRTWSDLVPYSNTVVTLLLNSGIIGMLIFVGYCVKWVAKSSGFLRVFSLIFILVMCTDHVLFNWYFFYLLYWMLSAQDKDYREEYIALKL